MSRNLTAVREMSGIILKVREMLENILSGKSGLKVFIVSCIFVSIFDFAAYLHPFLTLCISFWFRIMTVAFLPPPLTITLVPA